MVESRRAMGGGAESWHSVRLRCPTRSSAFLALFFRRHL